MEMYVWTNYVDDMNRLYFGTWNPIGEYLQSHPAPVLKKNYNYKRIDDCYITIDSDVIFWYAIFKKERIDLEVNGEQIIDYGCECWRTVSVKAISNTKYRITLLSQEPTKGDLLLYDKITPDDALNDVNRSNQNATLLPANKYTPITFDDIIVIQTSRPLAGEIEIGSRTYNFTGIDFTIQEYSGVTVSNLTDFVGFKYKCTACCPTYIINTTVGDYARFISDLMGSNWLTSVFKMPAPTVILTDEINVSARNSEHNPEFELVIKRVISYNLIEQPLNLDYLDYGEIDFTYGMPYIKVGGDTLPIFKHNEYKFVPVLGLGCSFIVIYNATLGYDSAISLGDYVIFQYMSPLFIKTVDYNTYQTNANLSEINNALYEQLNEVKRVSDNHAMASMTTKVVKGATNAITGVGKVALGAEVVSANGVLGGVNNMVSGISDMVMAGYDAEKTLAINEQTYLQSKLSVLNRKYKSGTVGAGDIAQNASQLAIKNIPIMCHNFTNLPQEFIAYKRLKEITMESVNGYLQPHTIDYYGTLPIKIKCSPQQRIDTIIYAEPFTQASNVSELFNALDIKYTY